jgi:hypothetical protein
MSQDPKMSIAVYLTQGWRGKSSDGIEIPRDGGDAIGEAEYFKLDFCIGIPSRKSTFH